MHFFASQKDLALGISKCIGAVEKKTTMPQLGRLLFSSTVDGIEIRATDLEVSVCVQVDAKVKTAGQVALPASTVSDYLKRLEGDVEIKVSDKFRASIVSGSSRSSIAGYKADDFPEIPEKDGPVIARVSGKDLARMIAETDYVIDAKPGMGSTAASLLTLGKDEVTLLARSNSRMSLAKSAATVIVEGKFPLSQRCTSQIKAFCTEHEEIDLYANQAMLILESGGDSLSCRQTVATFPDLGRVLAVEFDQVATVNRKALRAALDRISPLSMEHNALSKDLVSSLHVAIDGNQISLRSTSLEGEAEDCVPCSFRGSPVKGKFRLQFLSEPLGVITEENIDLLFAPMDYGYLKIKGKDSSFIYMAAGMQDKG